MTVHVGRAAPRFELASDAGESVSLRDFDGKWLVLYFYPRDNTPGCTVEAQEFTKAAPLAARLGAAIVGVSRDSVKSHAGFRDKFRLAFPLLSDPELEAHKAYGAWGKRKMYGREVEGTLRSTFLIGPDGRIARTWTGVRVAGHADAVLKALAEASGQSAPGGAPPKKTAAAKKTGAPAKKTAAKKTAKKAVKKAKRS
jgi:peroxiredoxin Q/BCP